MNHIGKLDMSDLFFLPRAEDPIEFEWRPLPGEVLLLVGHGFEIRFSRDPRQHPFTMTDPDGREVSMGYNLDDMQRLGERLAGYRAKFRIV